MENIVKVLSSSFSSAIIINLISAIIIFFAGYGFRSIIDRVRFRGRRRVWKPFTISSSPIPAFIVDKKGSPGSLGKVSLTDVKAFSDLRSEAQQVGAKLEVQRSSEGSMAQYDVGPIVCLGGPTVNKYTSLLLKRFQQKVPVRFVEGSLEQKGHFSYSGREYHTEHLEDQSIDRDFALLLYLRKINPENSISGSGLVAFGLRGVGTQSIVSHFIKGRRIYDRIGRQPNKSYWAFVSVKLQNGDPASCDVVGDGYF